MVNHNLIDRCIMVSFDNRCIFDRLIDLPEVQMRFMTVSNYCSSFIPKFYPLDVTKRTLKEFVLPTLNLPQKSIQTRTNHPRESSMSSITKREKKQAQEQPELKNTPCYTDLIDLCKRVTKLKLPNWQIYSDQSSYLALVKNDGIHFLPMFEIITNNNLEITLRYFTWKIPSTHPILQSFNNFRQIHVSQLIKMLESYQICKGK